MRVVRKVTKQLKTQNFKKLRNFKEVLEMLGIEKKGLIRLCKGQILAVVLQECQKLAVNNSMEKPVVLRFVDFSTIFCPRLFKETYFYLQFSPNPTELIFFIQTYSLLKLIFKESEMPQRPTLDIFQHALLYTLASSTNMVPNIVQI